MQAAGKLTIHFSPGDTQLLEQEARPPGPRVLVTGATGLLGRAVLAEFVNAGWAAVGTGHRRARPLLLPCNLLDEDAVRGLLLETQPQVIVHCAAERRPDVVERHTEAAVSLNVHATCTLAREAARTGAFFLYISTDYVFDGLRPPYGENDAPNPLNQYGRSKLEGEREALRQCPGAAVLRVPVLYGQVQLVQESAVTALWSSVIQGATESVAVDNSLYRHPTHTQDVAAVCRKIAERGRQDSSIRGIFHYSAKERMTKYEMAVTMATAFNMPTSNLVPQWKAPGVGRPVDPGLDCSRLDSLGLSVEPRPFNQAITSCMWPFLPDKRWRQTVFH